MADIATIERLESRLVRLVEGMLARKSGQMDFLIQLNRLDDILIDHQQGRLISESVRLFLEEYPRHFDKNGLKKDQRKRLGSFLNELLQSLLEINDADSLKLAEEVKDRLRDLGDGAFRLILKRPKEQVSLIERFRSLADRESKELEMLLEQHDHLLTCLDDVLKSAEAKDDTMYRHLAASIIYFLQVEGYKVDPYVKRLRRINAET